MSDMTIAILSEIIVERARQDAKFGADRNHRNGKWFEILAEEVGEAAKESLERRPPKLRKELIEVAAVAVAFVECLDRRGSR